jgi:hypothetical protein
MNYYGFTHGKKTKKRKLRKWRKRKCVKGIHLWDEVLSGGAPWRHYLVCDACGVMIDIAGVDTTYAKVPVEGYYKQEISNKEPS